MNVNRAVALALLMITMLMPLPAARSGGNDAAASRPAAGVPDGYKLAYSPDFTQPATIDDFTFTDPKAWRLNPADEGGATLELFGASDYKPPHRSPLNIALLKGKSFTDVVIDVDVCSTVPPAPNQDMIFVYGYQSPSRFYYSHIAVRPDGRAHHNCFIVNDADRAVIGRDVSDGVTWGQNQWHKVRIERRGSDGGTRVYFDDLTKPIMTAQDKTFPSGHIGLGSFDDKGKIRNLRVYAPSVEEKAEK